MNIDKSITRLIQILCTFVYVLYEAPAVVTIAMVSLAVIDSINVNFPSLALRRCALNITNLTPIDFNDKMSRPQNGLAIAKCY